MATPLPLTESDRLRLLGKIEHASSGCWVWTSGIFKMTGYGLFCRKYDDAKWRPTTAHRASYEVHKGPIPDGLQIDHLCRNRKCVNPDHLEAVTQRENILRGSSPAAIQARQTHCKHGHEFTPENTKIRRGKRECIECVRAFDRERGRRKRRELRERKAS